MVRGLTGGGRENRGLRRWVEGGLSRIWGQFQVARSGTPAYRAETAFALPASSVRAECSVTSVMGLDVPRIALSQSGGAGLPYAFFEITSEADYSVSMVTALFPKLLRLAEVEKSVRMLADEIERNKRRVNALEYVMIPQLEETIAYIREKLSENERAALVRIMKVKGKQQ